ncbi:hypothetical protein FQR65_LT18501 [Abscondita terminalis]|nr:hypothetical protein FQR65_LT18501 [Abscondita terminalis]
MSIVIKRKLLVNKNVELNCKVWKKIDGYLAYPDCHGLTAKKLSSAWETIFPPPKPTCGYTNPLQHPLCAVPLPGFGHPHQCIRLLDDAQIHYRLPYEDPVVTYIDNGLFVIIRRKFRRFLTVNATNVNSRNVLKSSAAIREETHRHLQTAYYMIHPFSSGRVMWENVMAITFFSLFVLLPFKTALENTPPIVNVSVCIFDIICCCDICLSFNSGYSDKNTAKIIVNRNKVTRHYLKGYFFIDFLSSVPNALVTVFFYQFSTSRLILYFAYLKLIRIFTFLQYLDNIRDRQGYSVFNSKAIKFAIVFAIVLLWTTSFRHLLRTKLEKEQNTFIILGLLRSCLATMHNLSLIGYGFEPIYDVRVLAYVLMTLAIGVVLHLLPMHKQLNAPQ